MTTVFFDVDTQLDFLFPAGALYVPGAELRLPAIAALNRYAAAQRHPVISDMDAHAENDPEFRIWPPHCVAGTAGQAKAAETLLDKRVVISTARQQVDVAGAPQIIIEKQALDPFTNPNLSEVLEALRADQYVLYGVVTEYCVRCAANGLLATGKPVTLVTDAVETLSREASERTIEEFQAGGGRLSTVGAILGGA